MVNEESNHGDWDLFRKARRIYLFDDTYAFQAYQEEFMEGPDPHNAFTSFGTDLSKDGQILIYHFYGFMRVLTFDSQTGEIIEYTGDHEFDQYMLSSSFNYLDVDPETGNVVLLSRIGEYVDGGTMFEPTREYVVSNNRIVVFQGAR